MLGVSNSTVKQVLIFAVATAIGVVVLTPIVSWLWGKVRNATGNVIPGGAV
jgi:uncharacterized membrane protein